MKKIALLSIVAASLLATACTSKIGEGNVAVQDQPFQVETYKQTLENTYAKQEADLQRQSGQQAPAATETQSNGATYSSSNLQ